MSNRKRLSTKKHGTLVTLTNIDSNITSLIAKWAFKILSNTTLPSYSSLWYYELYHMSIHLGYKCPDHFLNSTNSHAQTLSRAKPHQLKFNLFTLSCMLSYKEMGHTRIISPTWEDIVDQPLFDNRHINQPNKHQRSGMRTHTGNQEINIFFISLSVQARWGGSFELLLTWFWPLDQPLEFFKIFFLFSDPHFRRKKKCSDSPENSTNRPDDIKSGPNLVSDRFFDFSQKKVSVPVPKF